MSMRCPQDSNEVFSDEESFCTEHLCPLEPVVAAPTVPEAEPTSGATSSGATSSGTTSSGTAPTRQPWSKKVCWHCDTESPNEANADCLNDDCRRSLTPPELYLRFRDGEVEVERGEQAELGRRGEHGQVFRAYPNVSRRHALVGVGADGMAWITPVNTPNGTFVNGTELQPAVRTALHSADVVRFGAHAEGTVTLYDH
ncbi:hypothetical protein GCM10011609_27620 [Lentzea pudingi]|uniref:FHA domain-containing protein n=1 Tax=Lentzea pudingi TaxID=1789439 RepID=A0ABQ2HR78_9PSEU|nr:FHA domain-containing protein [Lentzea pudingi]GGM89254.1 hypothetical protein GCM10011609_27620 [Lentzea pudingi]